MAAKVYCEFYSVSNYGLPPWYNGFGNAFIGVGQISSDLTDDANSATGWTLDVIQAFNGAGGTTSVGDVDGWPAQIYQYNWNLNSQAQLRFGGLTPGETFNIRVAGHTTSAGRNTTIGVPESTEVSQVYTISGTDTAAAPIEFNGTVPGNGQVNMTFDFISVFGYLSGIEFTTTASGPTQASVRLADLDGIDRANLPTVPWAWYDSLPQTGVGPTDTGTGSTDANGNMTVDLANTTLTSGQVGYLLIDLGGVQSIHAVTIS